LNVWVKCCLGLQQLANSLDSWFHVLYIEGLQNTRLLMEDTEISRVHTQGCSASLLLQYRMYATEDQQWSAAHVI